jgi:hypothetical protein
MAKRQVVSVIKDPYISHNRWHFIQTFLWFSTFRSAMGHVQITATTLTRSERFAVLPWEALFGTPSAKFTTCMLPTASRRQANCKRLQRLHWLVETKWHHKIHFKELHINVYFSLPTPKWYSVFATSTCFTWHQWYQKVLMTHYLWHPLLAFVHLYEPRRTPKLRTWYKAIWSLH